MPEETPESPNRRKQNQPGSQEPQFNWRSLLLVSIAVALIGGAFLFRGSSIANTEEITFQKFESLLKDKKLLSTQEKPIELVIEEGRNTQTLSGYYLKKSPNSEDEVATPFKTSVFMPYNGATLEKDLSAAGITPNVRPESNMLASTILNILPIALFLVVLYFFFRSQIKMAGR